MFLVNPLAIFSDSGFVAANQTAVPNEPARREAISYPTGLTGLQQLDSKTL